ncbi:hypothetical protein C5167_016382 [Papaver somniferum]|uniref:probable DNA-3-methyladenine glycosylase 2 n=1 Tax=Papaver somniferum TaxID=3469 RepID=UPI000E6FA82D|nr:probable DNA-3-methyladenine glycosylase 2 [Papaver somniferum]RZC88521.1 hypothetical protein C5167_016382 [Papaver somniferum]
MKLRSSMGEQTNHKHQPSESHRPLDSTSITISPTPPPPLSPKSEETSQTQTSTTSKIPFRPRKIRKLEKPENTSDSSNSKPFQENNSRIKTPKIPIQQIRALPPRIVTKTLSCEGEIECAIRHLKASDPIFSRVIDCYDRPVFSSFDRPFLALTKSILYQQLALKAGTSIYTRFISLCGGESSVIPESVLATNPQQLRQIGVSARKASYLHDLANKYKNGILSDSSIVDMDDKSLFTMLTMVKGIGSWSVHMFMMNSLHRPDVLPMGDLGVRKGVELLYGLEELPRPSQMEQLCEKWRPYRTVASMYMWRLVDTKSLPSVTKTTLSVAVVGAPNQQKQQQQQQQEQQQQPQALQLIDPISGIANLGVCAWGEP